MGALRSVIYPFHRAPERRYTGLAKRLAISLLASPPWPPAAAAALAARRHQHETVIVPKRVRLESLSAPNTIYAEGSDSYTLHRFYEGAYELLLSASAWCIGQYFVSTIIRSLCQLFSLCTSMWKFIRCMGRPVRAETTY